MSYLDEILNEIVNESEVYIEDINLNNDKDNGFIDILLEADEANVDEALDETADSVEDETPSENSNTEEEDVNEESTDDNEVSEDEDPALDENEGEEDNTEEDEGGNEEESLDDEESTEEEPTEEILDSKIAYNSFKFLNELLHYNDNLKEKIEDLSDKASDDNTFIETFRIMSLESDKFKEDVEYLLLKKMKSVSEENLRTIETIFKTKLQTMVEIVEKIVNSNKNI